MFFLYNKHFVLVSNCICGVVSVREANVLRSAEAREVKEIIIDPDVWSQCCCERLIWVTCSCSAPLYEQAVTQDISTGNSEQPQGSLVNI